MKRIIAAGMLVILLTFSSGCSMLQTGVVTPTLEDGNTIYYMNNDGNELLTAHYAMTATGDKAVSEMFQVLQNGQYSEGRSAIPADLVLERSAWQEKSVVLYLTGAYPEVGTVEEILCRSALVCTMVQVDDVGGVTIYVDNQPLKNSKGEEIGVMTADMFLSNIESGSEDEYIAVTLYFSNEAGDRLVAERVMLTRNSDQSLEQQIINKLIQGPGSKNCCASLPAGTKAISVSTQNRICYVNLESSFMTATRTTEDYIPIYSMVNSLTELSEVDSVQLMIDGSTDVSYGQGITFALPLTADPQYNE